MKYIKFDTIDSTNDFLKSYSKTNRIDNFFYVYADYQNKGRGQHSNTWQSDCCKNLLLSIFFKPDWDLSQQQRLNQAVALSIVKVLQKFNICDVKIKLPNDIMSGNKKLGGILIENVIYKKQWKRSIIGIGLNVNQDNFVNLPQAVSMKNLTGVEYDREKLIKLLIDEFKKQIRRNPQSIKKEFDSLLNQ